MRSKLTLASAITLLSIIIPAHAKSIWYMEHMNGSTCIPLSMIGLPNVSSPDQFADFLRMEMRGSSWSRLHATITVRNIRPGEDVIIAREPLIAGGTVPVYQYFFLDRNACMRSAYPGWRP